VQENTRRAALPREVLLRELINTELDSSQKAPEAGLGDCQGTTIATEVNSWLDATRWQQLFANVPLLKAALLNHMTAPNSEPNLCICTLVMRCLAASLTASNTLPATTCLHPLRMSLYLKLNLSISISN
jgi:hypothetical protein